MKTNNEQHSLEGFDFFKSLLPSFEKKKLLESCDLVEQNVINVLLPIIQTTLNITDEYGVKINTAPMAVKFQKEVQRFASKVKFLPVHTRNYATILNEVMQRMMKKEEYLRMYIKQNFSNIVVRQGLTFQHHQVIRLIDLMNYYVNYAITMTHQIIYEDINAAALAGPKPLLDVQIKELNANFLTFVRLTEIFAMDEQNFEQIVQETADIVIEEAVGTDALAINGDLNTDPLRVGFMPVVGTAILLVRNQILVYQIKKYERNKLVKQCLELRLLSLRQQQEDGDPDPQIQRSIEALVGRIQKLDYEIDKFEQSAEG